MRNLFKEALRELQPYNVKHALEAIGIKETQEDEITIYAKIGNMEGLAQASFIEKQEQADIKTDIGKIRVRKVTQNGRVPVFELTTKRPISMQQVKKNRERTKKINEEVYDMFMDVAPYFQSKTRYVFKTEQLTIKRKEMEATIKTSDLSFEVDIFTKADGSISEWCKIDLEIDKIADILKDNNISVTDIKLIAVISKLPFAPNKIVIDDGNQDDPDKKELIDYIWKYEFLIPKEK